MDDNKEEEYESMDELLVIMLDNLSESNSNDTKYLSDETGSDETVDDDMKESHDITKNVKKEIKNEKKIDFVSIWLSQQTMPYRSNPKHFAADSGSMIFCERLKRLHLLNSNYDIMTNAYSGNNNYNYNGSNNNNYYYNKTKNISSFTSNNSFTDATIYRENKFGHIITSNKESMIKK